MRIFKNCMEMIKELPREVFTRGIEVRDKTVQGKNVEDDRDYLQKELYGTAYTINDVSDVTEMLDYAREVFNKTHLCVKVADKWFWDLTNNMTTRETWFFEDDYSKEYFEKFCNEKGTGASTYGYGERTIPQLPFVIQRLRSNLYSRGAYISVFDSRDVSRIGKRVPCTLNYGFSARRTVHGDKLNMFLHMRSQDLVNFMALDLYKAIRLLEYVAKEVKVDVGKIIVYVDSLHAYYKDVPQEVTW